jgi:hypothetical protein
MNSSLIKKIGIVVVAVLFLLQFVRPSRNEGDAAGANDILHAMNVPASVQKTLETSCYDCHSNHTVYPWYSNIQPVGLWLKNHVDEGKSELNFSEFNTYSPKRKAKKMKEIAEEIEEGEMPLSSYTLIHGNAVLTEAQKSELIAWAKGEQEMKMDSTQASPAAEGGEESHESHEEHE